MDVKDALVVIGGLSDPSKMPCFGYSLPAKMCKTGGGLRKKVGSVCEKCYACKGRYNFTNVKNCLARRATAIQRDDWADLMAEVIGAKEKSGYFRWHDSGDIQDQTHLAKIIRVAELLPHISFYLPTKEHDIVKQYSGDIPSNIVIRLSAFMVGEAIESCLQSSICSSSVASGKGYRCPALDQGHKCVNCRACWSASVPNVDYALI
jgi:hypothetical protein